MVDPIADPTPIIDPAVNDPTPDPKPAATPKTFTEEDLNRIVRERLDREKKKYADYNDLKAAKAKLDELENAKKTDEEKALAKLKALDDKIAEKEAAIVRAERKEKKRAAIDLAKLTLPKDITPSDLLEMMPGDSDEEIEAAILRFRKMFPEPEPSKAIGGGSQQPPAKPPELKDRIAALTAQAIDPKTPPIERSRIQRDILALKLQAGGDIQVR